jgi:hypothetical protein
MKVAIGTSEGTAKKHSPAGCGCGIRGLPSHFGVPAMTRMTREFSLVLLGASALTTAYFLWPEKDFDKRVDEQARQRVGGGSTGFTGFIWIHTSYSSPGGRPAGVSAVSRGGFGSSGARFSAGG